MLEPEAEIRCPCAGLQRFAAAVLEAIGMRPDDAAFAAEVIVAADLAGHESHGLRRLPEYVQRAAEGLLAPAERPVVELDLGALLRLDGRLSLGHIALRDLTDFAIARARAHGICGIALRRASYAGRIADYCARGARAGIAILFWLNDSGAGQVVAPHGGDAPRLATNPIGVGLPRAGEPPFILDMATSVVAMGGLAEARDRGTPIPADWLTPGGALRPMGAYKGTGLALVAEALAGILAGAGSVAAEPAGDGQGVFCVALDIQRLRPLDEFTAELERMLAFVRDVPLEPGAGSIRFPGELGAFTRGERLHSGVPIQRHCWERLERLSAQFGLPLPAPFENPEPGRG
jgi:LDH2 family malate/lactate/ureidoglycolate dehydrogenase